MKIAVIGGGPGGFFFAVLMKRADPSHDITVFERNAPGATFGFGVVFPERSMQYLRDADPHVHAAFVQTMIHWDALEYRHRGRILRCGGHVFSGIARMDLLRILQTQAGRLGVNLCFHQEIASLSNISGYDLIVAADGIHSLARRELADRFRPSTDVGKSEYIWLGISPTVSWPPNPRLTVPA
jgi:anthraniloyl-CoA monooxygenase